MTGRSCSAGSATRVALRRPYLDLLRGGAVLVMVLAHTTDAWTRTSDRHTAAYRLALLIGGFGAPAFLFLAGITQSLAAGARVQRGASALAAGGRGIRHGLQIFALAFVFEVQSWLISGGDFWRKFTRVDILHIMGIAMCAGATLWMAGRVWSARVALLAAAAACVSFLTPVIVGATWPMLPAPVALYLSPMRGRAIFSVFPWVGFFLAGAAVGVWLESDTSAPHERRVHRTLLWAGPLLGIASYLASWLPPLQASASFWTTSPAFFFIRLGILLTALALVVPWRTDSPVLRTLCQLGASSLLVYWVHVEMVYGVPSLALHGALSFGGGLAVYALLCVLLVCLVKVKRLLAPSNDGCSVGVSRLGSPPATHLLTDV